MSNSNVSEELFQSGIAVIGMAGRFPGARNVEEFWENLCRGVESISIFTREEMAAAGMDPAIFSQPGFVPAGGVLDDIELFDGSFFGYSPRDAEVIDPQHRLFLECAWEALENAGYDPKRYEGAIGVFAGSAVSSYMMNLVATTGILEIVGLAPTLIANSTDYLTTRVSHKLNLRGPSLSVQTACSTSLVAVHIACQSILNGECHMALAGGVTIITPQKGGYWYQEGGILSPDGHCRTFDAAARGTVGGNGLGIVVLKRFVDAIADGDTVHAVIRGSAINNDGADKLGYTAPSVDGQSAVIVEAQAIAGVTAETISYVEAHGTATPLGDPVEMQALAQAFRRQTNRKNFCALGSVKTNIGHLDTAAGVAGLIKTVLSLRHRQLAPSLHFEQPNPDFDLAESPFYVNTRLREWKNDSGPRRAGVSSFGIGGTNAHVILEEAPEVEWTTQARPVHLLTLSARTSTALELATDNLARHLRTHPEVNFADVAYTLHVGRREFLHRRALVCSDVPDALSALEARDHSRLVTGSREAGQRPVTFMFPGQGAQYPQMGRGLYETEAIFREEVDRCVALLHPHLGCDLRDVLYAHVDHGEDAAEQLRQTRLTQPALFVVEYSLAQLLRSWGIEPKTLIGHSIGEYVAACLAGVFSLEDALALTAARGALMQEMPSGSMLATPLPENRVRALLDKELSLAAVNAPSLTVVAGRHEAVAALQTQLAGEGVETTLLHTSHAFHSSMMEPVLERFAALVANTRLSKPTMPFISNVTGTWIKDAEATEPQYWAQQLRQTVRFADGVRELLRTEEAVLLEVGPGQTLSKLVKTQQGRGAPQLVRTMLRHPLQEQDDPAVGLDTLGHLWSAGVRVNWERFHAGDKCRRIELPTYPFERQRYWLEPASLSPRTVASRPGLHKANNISDWFYSPVWQQAHRRSSARRPADGPQSYLVFIDERGVGGAMAECLIAEGNLVITVAASKGFARRSDVAFVVDPRCAKHYEELLAALQSMGELPQKIVHCWSLSPSSSANGAVNDGLLGSFYSLLYLAQALGKHHFGASLPLAIITAGAQEITGAEVLDPLQASALGLCKVISQEYPNINCRCIDINLPRGDAELSSEALRDLVSEIVDVGAEPIVAYRGKYRWTQTFEAMPLPAPDAATTLLRQAGVYLITGGFGRIGLLLAEQLARTARAKLVLIGRLHLPAREEWESWLAEHGPDDKTAQVIRAIVALEDSGAEILPLHADVAGESQMGQALEAATARFGTVHGIIHAAGINRVSPLQDMDTALCEAHFDAKVRGPLVLEKILRGRRLDFCLMVSSLASVLGGLGYGAYTAASCVMDALAHQLHDSVGTPWLTVNLDGWHFDEGISAPSSSSLAELTMTSAEGTEVLERTLTREAPAQVVVSTGNLQTRINQWIKLESVRDEDCSVSEFSQLHERPSLANTWVAPRTAIERAVTDIWQQLLGIEGIGIHDDFFELGGHSLLATQILSHVRREFQVEIALRRLLEMPTVAALAEGIESARTAGKRPEVPPITPVPRDRQLPLSFAQQRLWFLDQLEPGNPFYTLSTGFRLAAPLDVAAVERSLNEVLRRHEVLRTTIMEVDGEAVQVIKPEVNLKLLVVDLSVLGAQEREVRARQLAAEEARRPFDLAHGPLLRSTLLRLSEELHIMLLSVHHIVYDWWSTGILIRELTTLYEAFSLGKSSPLPEFTVQYADYAIWQREWLQGDVLDSQLAYWKSHLARDLPSLSLPTDKPRPPVQTFNGALRSFDVAGSVASALGELSRREGATLFMVLLAAFKVLLCRYSGQSDITVGTPVAGRNRAEVEHLIGFFVNTLVLRTDLAGDPSFVELLRRVKEVCLGAYAHQDVPFERLVEELQPVRDLSRTPLFQVAMALQQEGETRLRLTDLEISPLEVESHTAKFDLTLYLAESERGLSGMLEYNTDLFEPETARRIVGHFQTLLAAIANDPAQRISAMALLMPDERQQIMVGWNCTQTDFQIDRCLHELFEQQVEQTPDAIALISEDQRLTYRELNARANQLARHLRGLGVTTDQPVGVLMERSVELVVALLGILKVGGAYLPLEPTYPQERLDFMIRDSRARMLLTQHHLVNALPPQQAARVLCLDTQWERVNEHNSDNLFSMAAPESAAYVIYTSGSTGQPKAVVNIHRAICNRLLWMQEQYQLTAVDRVLQKTPFSFDVSVWEFFWPLIAGATLVMARPEGHRDPAYLRQVIIDQRITGMHFVPAMLQAFLEQQGVEHCTSLRDVFCSGEALSRELQECFFGHLESRLHNLYGPTEAAIDVTFWECNRDSRLPFVPIGRPIANVQTYIVDAALQLVPIGVCGELYLGGVGLARGYLNRPDLTAARFVPDPFSTEPGGRLYRTGDLARYRADGTIEFLGRADQQVKVRGFRIELGEIEATARAHPAVADTIVSLTAPAQVAGRADAEHRLVCYLVPNQETARSVRQWLRLERQQRINGHAPLELPNGMLLLAHNRQEVDFMYDEVFVSQSYLQHGIRLEDGACVFDVGANVGMFTAYVGSHYAGARVYAFEPIPEVCELLRLNAVLHTGDAHVFDYGLGAAEEEVTFTYYPNVSLISGRYADPAEEQEVVRRYMRHSMENAKQQFEEHEIEETLRERLESRTVSARVRTLSDVMREQEIAQIDLLKIDVEKSEEEVLAGVRQEDWTKIRQIVVEVHDMDGRVHRLSEQLRARGFQVAIEQDKLLRGTALYNLYARRPESPSAPSGNGEGRPLAWYSSAQLIKDVEAHLRRSLPEYMVPSAFILLNEFPLTASGKVNRRALPAPDSAIAAAREGRVAPRNRLEESLAGIWAEVLGLEEIGINDNFFAVGGHSLLATRLVSRIKRALPVELELRQIFETPTIAGFAERLMREPETAARIERQIHGQGAEETVATAIPRRTAGGPARLSFAQQRLWFLDQFEPGNPAYNMTAAVQLRGSLDIDALERSISEVVRRHESLRTIFTVVLGQPHQQVQEAVPWKLSVIDLSALPAARRGEECASLIAEEKRRPFNLAQGPLLRTVLVRLGETEHALLVTMHHIISDGWSISVFVKEWKTLYEACVRGDDPSLPEPVIQYADFAEWQRAWLQDEAMESQLAYWREQLAGAPPTLDLPFDRRRPAVRDYRVASESTMLSPQQTEALQQLSLSEGVTLFMVLLAAFKVLLCRYSGQSDITVGTPVAGRNRAEVEHLIGFFVNTLVLRTDLAGDPSFVELLRRVKEVCLGAYAHQDVPFERLVEELQPVRDLSHTPLFQVLFLYQNVPQEKLELPGLELSVLESSAMREDSEWAVTDLVLSVTEDEGGLNVGCKYDPDLFDAKTIQRLLAHLSLLVDAIITNPGQSLARLPLLTGAEQHQLLVEWDRSRVERTAKCIHGLFESWVEKQPEAPAISFKGEEMSYKELSEQSCQVAWRLGDTGIEGSEPVAIMLDSGPLQIAALLGVLKAGAHFVCLDPHYPVSRLKQVLEEVEPRCLIVSSTYASLVQSVLEGWSKRQLCDVVLFEAEHRALVRNSANQLEHYAPRLSQADPEDLAYIVYTSGSTGRPKGIMQSHDGLCQYVEFQSRQFRIGPGKRVAQWAAITYDAAYAEIFGALCFGATLCMTASDTRTEPQAVLNWLRAERISALITVPSFARHLVQLLETEQATTESLPAFEYLLLAGEMLPVDLAQRWLALFPERPRLYNLYGPSEAILATYYPITSVPDARASVPVGNAIDGRHMLVLDRNGQLAPIGGRGEIYLRSRYLTRGYLHQPEETARVFIQNPLHNDYADPVYYTGDIGRWLPEGVLELFGRADNQVKIRGMRVELDEIETILAGHAAVIEAAVAVRERDGGEKRLTAYVAPANGLTAPDLLAFLKEQLPSHMIPGEYAFLDSLPRTSSGKVDRQALLSIATVSEREGHDFVPPRDELEAVVAGVWQELLCLERVGIYDNFFDLGGHSLLATQVVNKIRNLCAVDLQVRDFFEAPTVADLALYIEAQRQQQAAQIDKLAELLERVKEIPETEVESLLRQDGPSLG